MKKFATLLVLLLATVAAHAQFQKGKGYVGASLTGLNLQYNQATDFTLGVQAKAGYLFWDNWMLLAQASFEHQGGDGGYNDFSVGVGGRYYIVQNGLYLGVNAKLLHANHNYNDLMPGAEVGYAFYVNRSVTIEPAVYYDHSFKDSDYSTVGLKIGVGIYLFDD